MINETQTLVEFRAEQLRQAIQTVADRFRQIADEVERCAGDLDQVERRSAPSAAGYGAIAERVVNTVQWGVAAARLEAVALRAAEADLERLKGQGGSR